MLWKEIRLLRYYIIAEQKRRIKDVKGEVKSKQSIIIHAKAKRFLCMGLRNS